VAKGPPVPQAEKGLRSPPNMPSLAAAAEFDEISAVYDETREPLEPALVDAIATTLESWGVRRLLEVGVGTGRVVLPLAALGLSVTGVDASRGMLRRARAKGVPRLVRGSAYRLPFADRAFDASLFVHVLHILEAPDDALREAQRVAAVGAVGLVRPGPPPRRDPTGPPSARRLVVEYLRREGVDLPERSEGGPPRRERQLLTDHPPDRMVVLREEDVTEPLADQLAMFERRASRWTLHVPPELLARAVAHARAQVGTATHTYHLVQALALWSRPPVGNRPTGHTPPRRGSPGETG
jgi:ubiquinone/menaquinone biosynthesis C-methylase UbiE